MKRTIIAAAIILFGFCGFANAQKVISIADECVYLDELTAPSIPHTKVTCGFAPGDSKSFPKEVIENYLRRSGINAKVVNDVVVTREGEKLSPDAIIAAAEEAYKKAYPDVTVKIEQVRFPKDLYAVLQENFTISIDTTKFGMNYAEVNNGIRKTPVYMYVRAFKEGYIATDRIKPGEPLGGKIRLETIDITNFRQTMVSDLAGMAAAKTIAKGKTITEDVITIQPALQKGETVRIVYDNGFIKIETLGVIEENAFVGKAVSVRNTASQKIITANYVGNGIVMAAF